jgi:hypothetical protein
MMVRRYLKTIVNVIFSLINFYCKWLVVFFIFNFKSRRSVFSSFSFVRKYVIVLHSVRITERVRSVLFSFYLCPSSLCCSLESYTLSHVVRQSDNIFTHLLRDQNFDAFVSIIFLSLSGKVVGIVSVTMLCLYCVLYFPIADRTSIKKCTIYVCWMALDTMGRTVFFIFSKAF